MSGGNEGKPRPARVKLVVQQCLSAALRLPDGGGEAAVGRGMVVFVCFLRDAAPEDAVRAAELACAVRLCEEEEEEGGGEDGGGGGRRVTVLEAGGQVLVVPQATLGGKLKGKAVQYHGNVDKGRGQELYERFCRELGAKVGTAKFGVYGARQVLSMNTNGPYTHAFEL